MFGGLSYLLWGMLPLYFLLLTPSGAFEIVAWRVLFSLVFCAVIITVTRAWNVLGRALRQRRIVLTMGLAGIFIFINWQTYVIAATTGHVVEAALGYFINPIITVLLGVFVLRERLRPLQWVAIGVSFLAVVVLAVGYGSLPWISLILAFSFGFYGLIKKRVGPSVDAVTGLTLETAWLAPVAIVQLFVVSSLSGLTFGTVSPVHTMGLLAAGVITAVPLLLFAAAARRLPLTVLGLIQFVAPVLQFLVGVFVLKEAMPLERWAGFGLVWVALIILTVDMVASGRAPRRAALEPA
ncbi:EamA family transporter RarD [Cryobacterium sp. PH29-G1]|uniref:EamA family transporter RarD n=1 Tax=Cryobacterium sp. PH29-G1 TaxID=3046211 RepID=UPI0024B8B1CC|nr:EamA family transporter RarD [Cryobacterium sp. PH29-G1]MDJ0347827.1 EamA family transporter RarD [Cryobacterium sp. PH29-G1]